MGFWSYHYFFFLVWTSNCVLSLQASYLCLDHEKSALLRLKHSFIINCAIASDSPSAYPKVKSWGGQSQSHHGDCCSWDGVSCDEDAGYIIGLNLASSCLYGTFPSNSSLFDLTHLQHLSLSDNHFNHSQIPSGLGQFSKLVSLDLSNSAFSGQIPFAISELSMLSLLDLSLQGGKKASELRLEDPNLEKLVQNLTLLNRLHLDLVDISSPVPMILANLKFLKVLRLQFCKLYGQFPTNIFHLPRLETLYLTGNAGLEGLLPEFQGNSPLRHLSLSSTSFYGQLPSSIGKLANLEELMLFDCDFSGPIPSSLGNLTKLTYLDLADNIAFTGDLPSSLENITQLQRLGLSHLDSRPERLISWLFNLNKLTSLTLNYVDLGNEIPSVIGNITSLTQLALVGDQLTGGIPDWFMNLTELRILSLTRNQLEGPIFTPGISQLTNLNMLSLAGNKNLYGSFEEFLKLKDLTELELQGVRLSFLDKNDTNGSVPKLNLLGLDSCNLMEFPQFLQNQGELQDLDLSNNDIKGFIPQWFANVAQESLYSLDLSNNLLTGFEQPAMVLPWSHLEVLYLQGNRLRGPLPIPPKSMVVYQISSNHLEGSIPHQICQANSMNYFDISKNSLSGHIPNCISELSSSLLVLNMEGNKFNGYISDAYPTSCTLKMINLSGNQLEGTMPRSLANCRALEVLDIGRNRINDTFPSWLGGLPKLHILVLRHNNFHGSMQKAKVGFDFHSLRIIDLSNNFHTGDFPFDYVSNWEAMKLHNASQSNTYGTGDMIFITTSTAVLSEAMDYDYSITITNKGNDMQYTKVLTVFRVIDFSSNNFTGRIPNFIGQLRGLQAFNLSNNNLQGEIPSSLVNMTDMESLDLSNNMLSGEIPQDLAQLTFLEVFNVSHNLLKGPIPQGRQFGTFDNSSFVGNSGLCGTPLSNKCGNAFEPPPPSVLMGNNDGKEDESMLIDWIIRSLGCVSGFAIGCAFGKYLTDRNHEWFVETFGRRKRGSKAKGSRATRPRH